MSSRTGHSATRTSVASVVVATQEHRVGVEVLRNGLHGPGKDFWWLTAVSTSGVRHVTHQLVETALLQEGVFAHRDGRHLAKDATESARQRHLSLDQARPYRATMRTPTICPSSSSIASTSTPTQRRRSRTEGPERLLKASWFRCALELPRTLLGVLATRASIEAGTLLPSP